LFTVNAKKFFSIFVLPALKYTTLFRLRIWCTDIARTSLEMHRMITFSIKAIASYTEQQSQQVLISDTNNDRMKNCFTVCPVNSPVKHLGV
jgi:hypothetical protein